MSVAPYCGQIESGTVTVRPKSYNYLSDNRYDREREMKFWRDWLENREGRSRPVLETMQGYVQNRGLKRLSRRGKSRHLHLKRTEKTGKEKKKETVVITSGVT